MVNGRPPDLVPCVQSGLVLKRPRSPSDVDLHDDCKRFWEQDGGGFQGDSSESMEMKEEGNMSEESCVVGRAKVNFVGKSPLISIEPDSSSVVTDNSNAFLDHGCWLTLGIGVNSLLQWEGEIDVQRTTTDVGVVPSGVVLNAAYHESNLVKKSKDVRVVAGKAVVGHERLSLDKSLVWKTKAAKSQGNKENIWQAAHADLDPGKSIKAVVNQSGSLENVPRDDNRDVVQHIDGIVIPAHNDQPMVFDQ
ncbi:hypothetical protein V6N11_052049 [Hibiscus sabdariffa]|uniref:Uncharacterized protein n=1 Tax=Hibiscus sabdariffa TaxID=183260 RepID=A0ABR2U974_9ROSI